MAKDVTEDSRYQSKYGGGFVTSAQFIAELTLENSAAKSGKGLPPKFWNSDTWKKSFLRQVQLAHSLLNLYDSEVIIKTLRATKCYSLQAKFFLNKLEEAKLPTKEGKVVELPAKVGVEGREGQKKQSLVNLLDD